jgi:type VI secretion system protein ImpH
VKTPTLVEQLFDSEAACGFDPFQAVAILERLSTGAENKPIEDLAYFVANVSMSFPPSPIAQIIPAFEGEDLPGEPPVDGENAIRRRYTPRNVPIVVLNFFGVFGPCGALPLPYTRQLVELDRGKGRTRFILRDWLDLFNHRMTCLLYRAWEKYRFPVGFARQMVARAKATADTPMPEVDPFTQSVLALCGLGSPALRNRIRVSPPGPPGLRSREAPLAKVEDLALLHYAGSFARRKPSAHELGALLTDYFGIPVRVETFSGQWLALAPESQSRLTPTGNARLGVNTVAGERVWDVGSQFRLCLGPLRYASFEEYLPDTTALSVRKSAFMLSQITRLYAGPEFDFEIRLDLVGIDVPPCQLKDDGGFGVRLGWNSWMPGDTMPEVVTDVAFPGPCQTVF